MAALAARLSRQVVRMSHGPTSSRVVMRPGSRAVVVTLPAEIDITNGEQVHDAVARALADAAAVLVADAAGTAFCDCAGVSALTRAHHQAAMAQSQLRVVASPAVRRVLELTGASQLLNVYPTVDAALDAGHYLAPSDGTGTGTHPSGDVPPQ